MKVYHNILDTPLDMPSPAVTLGTFDGLHRGHLAILDRLCEVGDARQAPKVAVTYDPHPQRVLSSPERAPRLLSTLPERLERFERTGVDAVVVVPFSREFSRWPANRFVDEVLCGRLHAGCVVVGYDHAFGHDRRGKTDTLHDELGRRGIPLEVVPPVKDAGGPIKSSRIRRLLLAGELDMANLLLGYRYSFSGEIVPGNGRGADLGFPTANIRVPEEKQLPADAIYGAEAVMDGEAYPALVHIGPRPTIGEDKVCVEAHMLEFPNRDLYGQSITITPEVELRKVEAFGTLQALVSQIEKDREQFMTYRRRKENARASQ